MIRKLTERDRKAVLEYLSDEPAHTTFFVADIRDYGFDDERFSLWGDVTSNLENVETFDSLFCLFYGCLHVYSHSKTVNVVAICDYAAENGIEFQMLAGKESIVASFSELITFTKEHRCHLAELRRENFTPHTNDMIRIQWATVQDAEEIHRLRANMPEFRDILSPLEQLVDLLSTGKGRVLIIRENGHVVSSATESVSGRIGYVCTDPVYRGRGLASLLVSKLAETMLAESLVPSLSYENPVAGRIYRRLGFRDVGRTAIFTK